MLCQLSYSRLVMPGTNPHPSTTLAQQPRGFRRAKRHTRRPTTARRQTTRRATEHQTTSQDPTRTRTDTHRHVGASARTGARTHAHAHARAHTRARPAPKKQPPARPALPNPSPCVAMVPRQSRCHLLPLLARKTAKCRLLPARGSLHLAVFLARRWRRRWPRARTRREGRRAPRREQPGPETNGQHFLALRRPSSQKRAAPAWSPNFHGHVGAWLGHSPLLPRLLPQPPSWRVPMATKTRRASRRVLSSDELPTLRTHRGPVA